MTFVQLQKCTSLSHLKSLNTKYDNNVYKTFVIGQLEFYRNASAGIYEEEN